VLPVHDFGEESTLYELRCLPCSGEDLVPPHKMGVRGRIRETAIMVLGCNISS
jgi:hypothetical protein